MKRRRHNSDQAVTAESNLSVTNNKRETNGGCKETTAAVGAGSAPHTGPVQHTEAAVHAAHANMQGGDISVIYAAFVQVSNAEQPQQCATRLHHICVCDAGRRHSELLRQTKITFHFFPHSN